uniref:Sphingolipid 4-desaturase n=1 Tax=Parascaris univalens TaxID=6257 RepID=A0A915AUB6_PARUN
MNCDNERRKMGQRVSRDDFIWTYTEQPHMSRRQQIVAKYPKIKKLFGIDPSFKYVVAANVFAQILACFLLKDFDSLDIRNSEVRISFQHIKLTPLRSLFAYDRKIGLLFRSLLFVAHAPTQDYCQQRS